MSQDSFGKVIAEIGLNHLGSISELNFLVNKLIAKGLSTTIQVRESNFYEKYPNLWINIHDLAHIRQIYKNNNVNFGIAIGPIDQNLLDEILGLELDFIKLIGICSANPKFLDMFFSKQRPFTFISNGSWDALTNPISYANKNRDTIVHTVLSHELESQKISAINHLINMGWRVSYGQHSSDFSAIPLAIGAGAESIFLYVGDKSKKIPDLEHAIDINNIYEFSKKIATYYRSLKIDSVVNKIKFIG